MRRFLILAMVGAVFSGVAHAQSAAAPPATVAFVSGNRISQESDEGKAGQLRVQTLQRERAEQLRTRQQALEALRALIAKAPDAASKAPLQQQEAVQRTDLERATAQAQLDLQTLQRQISAEIQPKLRQAIEDVLKGRPITLVLQQETAVVWAAPGLDLTNEVIAAMNKRDAAGRATR